VQEETMSEKAINAYAELSIQISKFPPEKTSEFYFNELLKEGHLETLDEEMDLSSSNCLGHVLDSHDKWDELSQEEKDFVSEKLKEILKDGVKEANKKGWGSISASTRVELNNLISNEINWKSILKRFCGFTRKDDRLSTIRRLNKKYPGIHPGTKKDNKPMIAIYIDESGSMSDDELEKLYSELQTLSNRTDFYVYKFDCTVDKESGFLWKKGKKVNVTRNLSGGTSFDVVTKHALDNKKKFDGYIIFTDGCAAKPKPSRGLKRAYMLLPNTRLTFTPDNSDIVINMK
jgi:predicted metal-dependent peptidase